MIIVRASKFLLIYFRVGLHYSIYNYLNCTTSNLLEVIALYLHLQLILQFYEVRCEYATQTLKVM
jgi:hypothetical protein